MHSLNDLQDMVCLALNEIGEKHFRYVKHSLWHDITEIIANCDKLRTDEERGWMKHFLYEQLDVAGEFNTVQQKINVAEILMKDIAEKVKSGESPPETPA
jgi:hypothetical protein